MKSSYAFEKKEKNDVEFKMEIGAEKFEEAVKKAYQKTKHKYTADGFRKGKVPKKILEMKYGEGIFYDDAINILFPEEYTAAIEELELDPVDRPSIDLEQIGKNENLILKVTVTVKPEITLGDYKGIEAKKVEYNVTDEDVDQEIQSMQERNSRLIQVDREVKDGDSVTIDYEGYVGDEQFEGGTAENQVLVIGSGSFVPGFEEQLIGHKAGDDVEVKVTFPEEYHENLAGKDAVFKVTIKEVQEKEMPELDDEFAKDVSEFDTLEELKNDLKEKQEKTKKQKAETEQKTLVLDKVLETTEVDVPDVMIEDQVDEMIREFEFQLQYQGLNLDSYLKYLNKEKSDLREDMKKDAEKKVKSRLALEAVSKQENIEVSDEDVETEIKRFADEYKTEVEEFKKSLKAENYDYIKKDLKITKTMEFLVNNAKLS